MNDPIDLEMLNLEVLERSLTMHIVDVESGERPLEKINNSDVLLKK